MKIIPVCVATFAIAVWACKSESKSPPEPQPAVAPASAKECKKPTPPTECPFVTCGGNSPVVNGFPINGVRTDNECNPEGVQMLRGSLKGGMGNACDGATLDVRDNKLVGIRLTDDPADGSNGTIACKGDKLKNAKFVLRSHSDKPDGSGKREITVEITDIKEYTADNGEKRMAYRMEAGNGSLCSSKSSGTARDGLGLDVIPGLTDPPSGEDYVIPVKSELYDRVGYVVKPDINWANKQPEWINLACVDDALAKRSLYDLYTDNVEHSRAALMMLVANYCGNLHVTMRGVYVAWQLVEDKPASQPKHPVTREQKSANDKMLEAQWGEEGAVCLENPRLLYMKGTTPEVPSPLPADLSQICPNCTPDKWANAVRECGTLKPASSRPDYKPNGSKLPTCDNCGAKCKGRMLHSYIVPGQQP